MLGRQGGQGGLSFLRGHTLDNAGALPLYLAGGSRAVQLWFIGAALLAVVAWCAHVRRSRLTEAQVLALSVVTAWLVGPPLLALCASTVKPMFGERYFLFELPALVLLVVSAVGIVDYRVVAGVFAVGVVLGVVGVRHVHQRPPRQDFRTLTAAVLERARPGDVIVFDPPYLRIGFQHYLGDPRRSRPPASLVPDAPWTPVPLEDWPPVPVSFVRRVLDAGTHRVWFVSAAGDGVAATPLPWRCLLSRRALPGLDLRLYRACPVQPPGGSAGAR